MRFQFNPFTDKLDISGQGPGTTSVDFLTGNSGGPVAADASFNINVIGDNTSGVNTIGNLSPNTLTIFGLASSTTQVGTTRYATNAEAAAQSIGTAALTPANITSLFSTNYLPSSQGGTGLSSPAAHQLIVTNGSSPYTALGVASNGQLPIGSIGSDPVLGNITSMGGTITVTNGPGTINIDLAGGSVGVDSIAVQTGTSPIVPTGAGLVTINGAVVAAGTNPVRTDGTGANTMAVEVQISQAIAGADATKIGLSNFDSSSFAVDATGFVTASGTGLLKTLTGNTGGALSPTAGNISTVGTGSITIAGAGSTLTTQLTGLTNHNVLVGAGTATISNVAPSATSGIPLVSNGASADPSFTTAVVAGGGTGATSFTAYAVVCGGTTSTNPLQSIAGVGTSGQVLTSNGAAALPTFQTLPAASSFNQVVVQVFTSDGTYTPTSGMKYCTIEVVGGGGGGGGAATQGAATCAGAGGGGAGGYARKTVAAATIGASKSVSVGAAGTAGSAGNNAGGTGGTTSVGSTIVQATGGVGGGGAPASSGTVLGGAGGVGGSGDFNANGAPGGAGSGVFVAGVVAYTMGGIGGSSLYGGGGVSPTNAAGNAATNYGSGGSGAALANSASQQAGGAGTAGIVIITEFLSV